MHSNQHVNRAWAGALTLGERLSRFRSLDAEHSMERGHGRMRRFRDGWHTSAIPLSSADMRHMLQSMDTSEEELAATLGCLEADLVFPREARPTWWPDARHIAGSADSSRLSGGPDRDLLHMLIRPAHERICAIIDRAAAGASHCPWKSADLAGLVLQTAPLQALWEKVHRVLILELHAAKLRGQLRGGSSSERFRNFLAALATPTRLEELFTEYPVLARLIDRTTSLWVESSVELFSRLQRDWRDIRRSFFEDGRAERLTEIAVGRGDLHAGNRSVAILGFGPDRLVYKPRPLSVELHYQDTLRWLNRALPEDARLRALRVLDRQSHGWMEHVTSAACADEDELKRFFVRVGGQLALLAILRGTDCHAENLIAAGEHPVIVDIECLFAPYANANRDLDGGWFGEEDDFPTVFGSGLLPQWVGESAHSARDLGGLAALRRAGAFDPGQHVQGWGTDECCVRSGPADAMDGNNRPTWLGAEVEPEEYEEQIVSGLEQVHACIVARRDEFLRGPLESYRADVVRVILRDTQAYGLVLTDSYHPDCLRNAVERERVLARLWAGTEGRKREVLPFVPSEIDDLQDGDIPVFAIRADECVIRDSRGRSFADYVPRSSFALVHRYVSHVTERGVPAHVWAIRGSLQASRLNRGAAEVHAYGGAAVDTTSAGAAGREEILAAVQGIAERIVRLAYRGEKLANWATLERHNGVWNMNMMGPALGDGLAGMALFLSYLRRATGLSIHADVERQALYALRYAIQESMRHRESVALNDRGSLGEILWALARLEGPDAALDWSAECFQILRALQLGKHSERNAGEPEQLASAICGLLDCPAESHADEATALAERFAEELSLRARTDGCGGLTPRASLLTVTALFRLGEATGKRAFRARAAELARAFVSEFDRARPEVRDLVGLTCLSSLAHSADGEFGRVLEELLEEDRRAQRTLVLSAHEGVLLHLDLLAESEARAGAVRRGRLASAAAAVLKALEASSRTEPFTPIGLFKGVAAIGYSLLRAAHPQDVPSIVSLASRHPVEAREARPVGRSMEAVP